MTRLNTPILLVPKPGIVSLCEMAIAAGTTGHSVAVHFQDIPAHVCCKLWQYSMNFAGANVVRHVRNQSDVRTLPGACGNLKLILVNAPKLRTAVSWAIEMCSVADTDANSRPAIFSHSCLSEGTDDPGTALVLRADPVEMTAVLQWFVLGQIPTVPNWQILRDGAAVTLAPALAPILARGATGSRAIHRLREQDLLRALVTGAAVLRSLGSNEGQAAGMDELTLTADDYEQVRLLLQSPSVTPADEPCDPLARDMVGRANVYLQVKFAETNADGNPFRANGFGLPLGSRGNKDLITRREIVDLGNVNSRLVRQLVEYIRRRSDGYERFQRMGLVRQPPPRDRWQRAEVSSQIDYLRPWAAKQVRTHFDQLHRTGMITAERATANGPWRYTLPEELVGRNSAYSGLPTAAELIARNPNE
jgi:hypothetical protein